jgi:GntR family transcriptional regulator
MELRGAIEDLFVEAGTAGITQARVAEEVPPPEVQALLGLADGARLTVVRRVRAIEHQPFALTINYLPKALGRRLAQRDLYRFPLLQLLEEEGVRFDRADQTVEARLAEEEVAPPSGSSSAIPCSSWSDDVAGARAPIEVVGPLPADVYRYQIRLVRPRGPDSDGRRRGSRRGGNHGANWRGPREHVTVAASAAR